MTEVVLVGQLHIFMDPEGRIPLDTKSEKGGTENLAGEKTK